LRHKTFWDEIMFIAPPPPPPPRIPPVANNLQGASAGNDSADSNSADFAAFSKAVSTSSDGKISPDAVAQSLGSADSNRDGNLDAAELTSLGFTDAQAGRLMSMADQNRNNLISIKGANSELQQFSTRLDTNNDGEISASEFDQSYAKLTNDLVDETTKASKALGDKASGADDAQNDRNPETGCGSGGSKSASGGDCGGSSDYMASLWPFLLGLMDEDGDGRISPAELMKGMKKLDKNGDGKVTSEELMAGGMSKEQATNMLASMDKNRDGAISIQGADSELETAVTAANVNGDNEITQSEFNSVTASATAQPSMMDKQAA
jgi:Ca2+-binding EF-hand superfamily protein